MAKLDHTRPLTELMDFDRVIEIREDGTIYSRPDVQAPTLLDEILSDNWEFFTKGYSMQDHYSGPIMHNSESIGGQLERDIRSTPGIYVSLVARWTENLGDEDDEGPFDEGWVVAKML